MHDAARVAFAALGPPSGSGSNAAIMQILFFGAIFAIFYFLLIRPQQKQRKERDRMLTSVKKGDRVVTSGGLHGTVVGLNEQTVVLKVADQVKLEFDRTSIGRLVEVERQKDA
jgi:preprotein translocase subunit YajC